MPFFDMGKTGNLYGNIHRVVCLALLMVFETVTERKDNVLALSGLQCKNMGDVATSINGTNVMDNRQHLHQWSVRSVS